MLHVGIHVHVIIMCDTHWLIPPVCVHILSGLAAVRSTPAVKANLVATPHTVGGREGQRTEVVGGRVHEVTHVNGGENRIPRAGPGSILVQHSILYCTHCDVCVQ